MAELDYAYLADFVSLQEGKLTAVGASFTFAAVPSMPIQMMLGVAGRVRAHVIEGPVPIEVKITPPDDSFAMSVNGDLQPGPHARPYGDGMVGLLFAINTQLPVDRPGLYTFDILIQGTHARRLAFEIELAEAP
ncbi:hypothetical protein DC31_02170 [Microbacterium sp. CH12i]|uniref:DUF6941 family protein n=1 Tax=Microbacterium sp. CH12i TaxID=1479651 RepID=UPI000461097A|nr:hypothetical protein [Microbacterium sp. CH12i]KDA05222.1 hypothetical protein DC31_02170 [Microbacterium sp. CH12i]